MSDWKEGANKRRDSRHTKISDEPTKSVVKPTKKKDTKKWCRGKEGVAHKTKCVDYNTIKRTAYYVNGQLKPFNGWKILVCTACGKELETYYGHKKHKPDWVKDEQQSTGIKKSKN